MRQAVHLGPLALLLSCTSAVKHLNKLHDEHILHSSTTPPAPLSSEWMAAHTSSNETILRYMYPHNPLLAYQRGDITRAWRATTKDCKIAAGECYCMHVAGSPIKRKNPSGWQSEASTNANFVGGGSVVSTADRAAKMQSLADKNCSCIVPKHEGALCLFSDMRPGKLLAIIAACRAAGVTHIVEEGRYGGLSAYVYALHGFRVTSIELVEIGYVANAMRAAAPSVTLLTGDGSQLVPEVVGKEADPRRVAVIFDGEKRFQAYETYKKVRGRVALAVFDDSIFQNFPAHLQNQGEIAWHTWDLAFQQARRDALFTAPFEDELRVEAAALASRGGLSPKEYATLVDKDTGKLLMPPGGMESLSQFHLSIVKGGAFEPPGGQGMSG